MDDAIAKTPKPKSRNYCLAFFEAVACIMIILIHCMFPGAIGYFISCYARFAVPFFFTVSGFFLLKSGMTAAELRQRLFKRIPRLVYLMVLAFIVNFIVLGIQNRADFGTWFASIFTWEKALYFLCFNEPFLVGVSWFLVAMIYAYLIIAAFSVPLTKHPRAWDVIGFFWIPVIIFVAIMGITRPMLWGIDLNNPLFYRTWYFIGLPFIGFGVWLSRHKEWLRSIRVRYLLIFLFFSFVLSIEERATFFILDIHLDYGVSSVITVILIYSLAMKKPELFKKVPFVEVKGNWTMYVYIFHQPLLLIMNALLMDAEAAMPALIGWSKPLILITVSLVISISFNAIVQLLLGAIKNRAQNRRLQN